MDDEEERKCMHYTQDDEGEYATRLTPVPQYTKLQNHRYRTKRQGQTGQTDMKKGIKR